MQRTSLEERIARAYEGLAPPAADSTEILADLPAQEPRARRRFWIPAMAAALLLAVAVWGWQRSGNQNPGMLGPDIAVQLPAVPSKAAAKQPRGKLLRVRLARGGRVLVRLPALDGEWAQVSLKGLAAYLGKAALEDHPWVLIEADRRAPWQHLQWLLTVCAEKRLANTYFAALGGDGKPLLLDARLPADKALVPGDDWKIKVAIRIVRVKQEGFAFQFGDRKSPRLVQAARWMADALRAVEKTEVRGKVFGEIKAPHRTPFRYVAAVLAQFRRAGYRRVDFYGTAIPGPKLREALQLPVPRTDWVGESGKSAANDAPVKRGTESGR